ncbi:FadR/GntR family transcriptional regulator [Hydrogenophaga sp. 5NK40-0174]|uniref:FadR/GntR family transcriptional regulator n=1 Tax=Hydrogenophaga sp. 5NK40-0174 TaxID=3127649 RepID=UPI003106228E
MDPVKTLGSDPAKNAAAAPVRARRPRGLVPEIVASIEADIREGRLQPGQKLPTESELVARFEVSRTVVREAISRLQASGLVETRHGIGTFAKEATDPSLFRLTAADLPTVDDVVALLELRISLETEAAGLAAQRREESHLQAMAKALASFESALNAQSDAIPSDFQFHMEVAMATGNRYFADLMNHLGTVIIPRTRVNTPNSASEGRDAYLRRVHAEHENIYSAIRAHDAEGARAAMRTHLSNSRERLRRSQAVSAGEMTG